MRRSPRSRRDTRGTRVCGACRAACLLCRGRGTQPLQPPLGRAGCIHIGWRRVPSIRLDTSSPEGTLEKLAMGVCRLESAKVRRHDYKVEVASRPRNARRQSNDQKQNQKVTNCRKTQISDRLTTASRKHGRPERSHNHVGNNGSTMTPGNVQRTEHFQMEKHRIGSPFSYHWVSRH
jgi:hypothetical protein